MPVTDLLKGLNGRCRNPILRGLAVRQSILLSCTTSTHPCRISTTTQRCKVRCRSNVKQAGDARFLDSRPGHCLFTSQAHGRQLPICNQEHGARAWSIAIEHGLSPISQTRAMTRLITLRCSESSEKAQTPPFSLYPTFCTICLPSLPMP